MEKNIGVGIIVGLVITSSFYIWNSKNFSKQQKIFLLICFIFPPAQWIFILIILAYNTYRRNNTEERIAEKRSEKTSINLDSSILDLEELKSKGILNEDEYTEKIKKINFQKSQQKIKSSTEYIQLKKLFENGILSKDEFDNKIKLLNTKELIFENKSKIGLEENYIIENKTYSAEQIKSHFENGNYFIDQKTIITLNDGSQNTFKYLKELSFLLEYFPPK